MADMAKVKPERFAKVKFTFTPSVRLVHSQHDVASVWQAVESGKKIPAARREKQQLVVWRKDFEVFHARVDSGPRRCSQISSPVRPSRACTVLLVFER